MSHEPIPPGATFHGSTLHGSASVRRVNEWAVLERVGHDVGSSVGELAQLTQLSRPTVNQALQRLAASGLVVRGEQRHGASGRSPHTWRRNARAGAVVSIDVGRTRVRVGVGDLGEATLATRRRGRPGDAQLVEFLVALVSEALADADIAADAVLATVVGVPGVFDPARGQSQLAWNQEVWQQREVVAALRDALCGSVDFDNDANLSTLGEQAAGHGDGIDNFVFLGLGAGVGAGLVLDGMLHRGHRGMAGEVGYLPLLAGGKLPASSSWPRQGALESQLSVDALAADARRAGWPVESLEDLARAVVGMPNLRGRVTDLLAATVLSLMALVDPALVVVGGGLGAHLRPLLPDVDAAVAAMVPVDRPRLLITAVGEDGALIGGLHQARRIAWHRAFDAQR